MGLLGPVTAVEFQRYVIDIAMMFGIFFIVALSLNFQYGNAGVPNMACALSASVGGYTVTAIVSRLIYWIGSQAGLDILPLTNETHWAQHNNCINVETMNAYIQSHAVLGIAMLVLSLALGYAAGWALGYVISLPVFRLKATSIIIFLLILTDASRYLVRGYVPISGGPHGMFVPNVLAWYPGDRTIPMTVIMLTFGILCYFVLRTMINSPFGRLMRAARENEVTLNSVGKDVTAIKRSVLMFGSGIISVAGVILSFYYSFVIDGNFSEMTWTYWPWLMLAIGGIGNNAGAFIGCAVVLGLRRLIIASRLLLSSFIWYPIVLFEQQLLGLMFLAILIIRPRGLMPEKPLRIRGVDYSRIMFDEDLGE